jgi:hypothetical protein
LTVTEGEQRIIARERVRSVLSGMLDNALTSLARAALLVSPTADRIHPSAQIE